MSRMKPIFEVAKRILADPNAPEYHRTAAREVLEDFISGREDHPFAEFILPMEFVTEDEKEKTE